MIRFAIGFAIGAVFGRPAAALLNKHVTPVVVNRAVDGLSWVHDRLEKNVYKENN